MSNKEKTLEENLQDPLFVNYNVLLHLKNIFTSLEEVKMLLVQLVNQEPEEMSKTKEQHEGTFR